MYEQLHNKSAVQYILVVYGNYVFFCQWTWLNTDPPVSVRVPVRFFTLELMKSYLDKLLSAIFFARRNCSGIKYQLTRRLLHALLYICTTWQHSVVAMLLINIQSSLV